MWLLPACAGPRCHLEPGQHGLPGWYDDADVDRLLLLLQRFLPGEPPVARLPARALRVGVPAVVSEGVLLVEFGQGEEPEPLPREIGARWVLVRVPGEGWGDAHWIDRLLKPPVLSSLHASFARPDHPFAVYGLAGLDLLELALRSEDAGELIALVEATFAHRLEYVPEGTRPADWLRSLDRAVGQRLAQRLQRGEPGGLRAALETVLGTGSNGATTLRALGLAYGPDDDLRLGPLARHVERPAVCGGLLAALPDAAWSEAARARAQGIVDAEVRLLELSLSLDSTLWRYLSPEPSLYRVVQPRVAGDAPEVFGRALAALEQLDRGEPQDTATARALVGGLRRGLQTLSNAPPPLATSSRLLILALRLASVRHPDDLADQARAMAELERFLGPDPAASDPILWSAAQLAVARAEFAHRTEARAIAVVEARVRAIQARVEEGRAELLPGSGAIRTATVDLAIDLAMARGDFRGAWGELERWNAEKRTRPGLAAVRVKRALWWAARGELNRALFTLRNKVLPILDREGALRESLEVRLEVAHLLIAQGEIDEARRVLREQVLPLTQQHGGDRQRAIASRLKAAVDARTGEPHEALRTLREEVLPIFSRAGDLLQQAGTRLVISGVLHGLGDLDEAAVVAREAVATYARLGAALDLLRARVQLAGLLLRQGGDAENHGEARQLLAQARATASRLGLPEAARIQALQAQHGWQDDPLPEEA
ncbi:MAG: hypothetical protein ABIO70_15420 [Pseudomonadota bacterium]